MNTKIFQKHVIKGTREFEIVGDVVNYRIKTPLGKEELSVVFSVLKFEPVISGSMLSFVSRVNGEALVELFLNKPDKETFEAFVSTMQQRISQEDFSRLSPNKKAINIDVEQIDITIDMLKAYINPDEINQLLTVLTEIKANPDEIECLKDLADAFNELGFIKTSVLTYAPYINSMLSGIEEDETHADHYK